MRMNFSLERKTLGRGNTCDLKSCQEMSSDKEQSTAASEPNLAERNRKPAMKFFPDLNDKRITTNLEPLHPQISALTRWWANWSMATPLEPPNGNCPRPPITVPMSAHRHPGTSRTLPLAPLVTARYSPDTKFAQVLLRSSRNKNQ